jgi:uncharacterized membrane protein
MTIRRFRRWYYLPVALVAAPVFIAIFIAVGGGIVMLLWNWLLPTLFGWPRITLWQGFGLLVLCRILFGRFGDGRRYSNRMTPEERDRFRQHMRERFCRTAADSQEAGTAAATMPGTHIEE